ncbi:MAG: thrombospondin type 3 repeat-containing protein [Kofleriaceae bacterium]|nr:thrombospondin type 3 repeat-containing protein [Kofleriaceae bacterium]MBP6835899.1 thrombospondin type 3 repeat-containing protein [Kofleriaceae bacterium]MBP9203336.1 thrombospondin type 3 repeat-containing protein [Kofleriaceae bacterium]
MATGSLAGGVLVVAITLCGACFQTPAPGLPCGPDIACPPGESCVAGTCQVEAGAADARPAGGIDAPPGPDGDLDGIPDHLDLCPSVADPGQFDEDLDQLGDACDLCPFRAVGAGGDVDADGDGVGDACDPGPEQHEWVYFTGFGVDDGQWTHSGGNWEVGGGSLTQSRSQTDLASARLPASMFTAPGVTLTVGGRVTEVGGTGRYLWLSVGEQGVGVDQTYLTCTHNTPTTGASIVAIEQFVMGDYNVVTSVPAAPLVSGGFELVAQSEPGGAKGVVRCTIGLSTGERLSLSLVAPQPTTGARGVYVEDLAVALDWAAVIALR